MPRICSNTRWTWLNGNRKSLIVSDRLWIMGIIYLNVIRWYRVRLIFDLIDGSNF